MTYFYRLLSRFCAFALLLMMFGCIQMPTERAGVSDMRPQISFRADAEALHTARVIVNGQDMGMVGDYIDNRSSLRILPGSHRIQVMQNGRWLIDENVYIADGVNRSFLVR